MTPSRITPIPALRSMTGFGRAEATGDAATVTVEARSVNHRHLDIALRLPRALGACEMDARRMIQSRLERGRIDVAVQLGPAPGQSTQQVRADAALAAQYVAEARELGRTVGLGGDVTLAWVLERPGVVRMQDTETPAGGIAWPVLAEVLGRALDELVACRRAEGEALGAELRTLHGALLGDIVRDEGRILTEVAIWADKTDVREEMTRLGAHLEQLTLLLDKGGAVGRALDFLIQELNREVNTIASKADDLELSQAALAAKGIIEKMREQAQNLE